MASSIRTVLWFNGRGTEAADFYCSLVPGSRVETVHSGGSDGNAFTVVDFLLGGVPYQILDAGPHFPLTEAVSIAIQTDDQAESDRLWAALIAEGGQESMCGWLKDRYGLSWQVYPRRLGELTMNRDPAVAKAALAAMMTMRRIDIAAIEAAVAAAG